MTSKSSFLVSCRENSKRRLIVWIVSILSQIIVYPGVLIIYLNRIKHWNKEGSYETVELFKKAMCDAATDALGFQSFSSVLIVFLAVFIGIHGFSYLYDRKKIDTYHSVPVSLKSRFAVVYINGILIYVIPYIISILLEILIAATQGSLSTRAFAECALAFLLNIIYFMVVYNTALLAVMLTGHMFVTALAVGVLLFIGLIWVEVYSSLKYIFFKTANDFYGSSVKSSSFSVVYRHLINMGALKRMDELSDITKAVMKLCGIWFIAALILGLLVYICYLKRPSEAAGKAITFNVTKPFLKIVISATVGLVICLILDDVAYSNTVICVFSMIIGTLLCAAVMEVIFEFDIRAAVKRPVTSGVPVIIAVAIFSIFYFDIFGYDAYIPDADDVESIAVCLNFESNYLDVSNDNFTRVIGPGTYLKENMFLTDTEPVLELAKRSRDIESKSLDERGVYVLYRLKSGKNVSRIMIVDFNDKVSAGLLNKIVGSSEYKEGSYQLIKDPSIFKRGDLSLTYKNGIVESNIPPQDAEKVGKAWTKDMENFDFDFARNNLPCGYIEIFMGISYMRFNMPVYESFENTIACLKECDAYYPMDINADDVLSLSISRNHNIDIGNPMDAEIILGIGAGERAVRVETVTEEFDDPNEIAEIVKYIYSTNINTPWCKPDMLDGHYNISITFKNNKNYPYVKGYANYYFIGGQVPEFVEERTQIK